MPTMLSLRIPKGLASSLEALAEATDRPKSYLVRQALETYLAEHEDYREALRRLRDPEDPVITSAELRRRLGR